MSLLLNAMRFSKRFNHCLFSNALSNRHSSSSKGISITLVSHTGAKVKLKGEVQSTLLDTIRDNLVMENYGICGGTPSCTTCHVMFDPEDYTKLDPPEKLEKDLLECTLGAGPTSRLGCQVELKDFMDGIEIRLPQHTRDMRNLDLLID